MGERRLESESGATRNANNEWLVADHAGWACDGWAVVRAIGLEQRDVHGQRDSGSGPKSPPRTLYRLRRSCPSVFARQLYLRCHLARGYISRTPNASQHDRDGNNEDGSRSSWTDVDGDCDHDLDVRV